MTALGIKLKYWGFSAWENQTLGNVEQGLHDSVGVPLQHYSSHSQWRCLTVAYTVNGSAVLLQYCLARWSIFMYHLPDLSPRFTTTSEADSKLLQKRCIVLPGVQAIAINETLFCPLRKRGSEYFLIRPTPNPKYSTSCNHHIWKPVICFAPLIKMDWAIKALIHLKLSVITKKKKWEESPHALVVFDSSDLLDRMLLVVVIISLRLRASLK